MGTSVAPALRYTSSDAFTAGAELAVPANSRSTKPTRNPLRADPPSQLNDRSDTVSSCPSGPCMAATTSAVSVAERAIAPTLSSVHRRVMQPYRLTRPYVGLSPATPHVDAGDTIDPFVSVPTANPTRPAAALRRVRLTSRSRRSRDSTGFWCARGTTGRRQPARRWTAWRAERLQPPAVE